MADAGPAYAASWSGGKDSLHAVHRARGEGRRVTHLFNIYEASTGRVRFHGVRRELLQAQAEALGLPLLGEASGAEGGFEAAFRRTLERLTDAGVEGVVFGNVHLADVREWYESRTRARGFDHLEPLWGRDPLRLVKEYLALGYRSRIVSVNLECGDPTWLGRELTPGLANRMAARPGTDPCGERGEYHTFAWSGPAFRRPVRIRPGEEREREGHRFLELTLDLEEEGPWKGEEPSS